MVAAGTEIGGLSPWVTVIEPVSGVIRGRFLAYEVGFRGGVRVAVGDIDGDGFDEVVTAPGPGRLGEIRVFRPEGTELVAYRTVPFVHQYRGGVEIAVGDVTGDGFVDLVASMSRGPGIVQLFAVTPTALDPVANVPVRQFRPFASSALGGASVATADIGTFSAGITVDATRPDGRLEIVVGSGAGTAPLVAIYDVSASPVVVQRLRPLNPALRGGLSVAAGRYDDDAIDDIIVASGARSRSVVEVWSGRRASGLPTLLVRQEAFADLARSQAAVFAVGIDGNGDGQVDSLLAAQGQGGGSRGIRRIGGGGPLSFVAVMGPLGPLRLAASRPRG